MTPECRTYDFGMPPSGHKVSDERLEEFRRIYKEAYGEEITLPDATAMAHMRQGELKGLQWSSIDWQNQSLAVRHSRCDYRKALGSPKSNRERYIPLDIDVYEMLHKRKKSTASRSY
jgi:integrase